MAPPAIETEQLTKSVPEGAADHGYSEIQQIVAEPGFGGMGWFTSLQEKVPRQKLRKARTKVSRHWCHTKDGYLRPAP